MNVFAVIYYNLHLLLHLHYTLVEDMRNIKAPLYMMQLFEQQ